MLFDPKSMRLATPLLWLLLCWTSGSHGQNSPAWVGTWASAPMQDGSGRAFQQQTLRQIIHISVSRRRFRLHLSNLFGDRALEIADVHLALEDAGSSVVKSSDRQVTFHGKSNVVIAPGESALSDPVDAKFPAMSNIAVSFFLPSPTGRATFHQNQHQVSYIAAGDVSQAVSLSDVKTTNSIYFFTGLDVEVEDSAGSVVTLGASITEGSSGANNQNHRWPDMLAERLFEKGWNIGVLNEGISGNKLIAGGTGQTASARFERDALEQPGVRWVIFSDDPINDLGAKQPPTAEEFIAAIPIKDLVLRAHVQHVKFLCSTLTPFKGYATWSPAVERVRDQVNEFLRSPDSGCDAVIDQDAATQRVTFPPMMLGTICIPTMPDSRQSRTRCRYLRFIDADGHHFEAVGLGVGKGARSERFPLNMDEILLASCRYQSLGSARPSASSVNQ